MSDPVQLRHRAERLLVDLASRSRARPGLFPVRHVEDFLAIIGDRLGWQPGTTLADTSDSAALSAFCDLARQLDSHPEQSHHWFALSQLRRGFPPLHAAASPVPPETEAARDSSLKHAVHPKTVRP